MDLYVYYEVADEAVAELRARLGRLCDELRPHRSRLMKRADGRPTWMEIHEGVDPDFEALLQDAVERHGIAALTGPRHVERFVELD